MRAKVQRSALAKAVSLAASTVDARASMPTLQCIRIAAADGVVEVAGTDAFTASIAKVDAEVWKPGATLINAKLARSVLASFPSSCHEIEIEIDGANLTLKAKGSRRKIATMDADDYPPLPLVPDAWTTLTGPALLHAISVVQHAVPSAELKPSIACVALEASGGKLEAAGIDGHRLAVTRVECTAEDFRSYLATRAIAPVRAALDELGAADAKIGVTASHVVVSAGPSLVFAKKHDDGFPPYHRVIPTKWKHDIRVSRDLMLAAIKGVEVAADQEAKDAAPLVAFSAEEGEIVLSSRGVSGEASERVPCDFVGKFGEDIGFNPRYLRDALVAMTADDVRLLVTGTLDPMVITPAHSDETTMVVMPQRI